MKRKILVNFIIIIFCLSMTCFTFATSVYSLKDKQKELEDKQNDAKEDSRCWSYFLCDQRKYF